MMRIDSARPFLAAILIACAGWAWPASAAMRQESPTVRQARELVDTYYGNPELLTRAAALLEAAYAQNPRETHLFVQAARITMMGGRLSYDRYDGNLIARYSALVDQALALDATNDKAHILKADVFEMQGRRREQLVELEKARTFAAGIEDPWLQVGFARYHMAIGEVGVAHAIYSNLVDLGPGTTASDRRAYIAAVDQLGEMLVGEASLEDHLRKYGALTLQHHYPTDGESVENAASRFLTSGMVDDAMAFARESLKAADCANIRVPQATCVNARMTLAASLYAKAAQLHKAGRPRKETQPLLDEANRQGFHRGEIMGHMQQCRCGWFSQLTPTLDEILTAR
ncbi:MAG: hypothetical protein JWQ07_553 [Ramlibacter sp.]|nr:hypothetical protein [Ramlibacter sp.]